MSPKSPEETSVQEGTDLPAGSVAGVTTSGGRRRGKRKIMKRVQIKDADGYLGNPPRGYFCFS